MFARIERAGDWRSVTRAHGVDVVRVRRPRSPNRSVVPLRGARDVHVVLRDAGSGPLQPIRGDRHERATDVRPGGVVEVPPFDNLRGVQARVDPPSGERDGGVEAVEAPGLAVVEDELEEGAGPFGVDQRPSAELHAVVGDGYVCGVRRGALRGHAPDHGLAHVLGVHLVELRLGGEANLSDARALEAGAVDGQDRAAGDVPLRRGQPRDLYRWEGGRGMVSGIQPLADRAVANVKKAALRFGAEGCGLGPERVPSAVERCLR